VCVCVCEGEDQIVGTITVAVVVLSVVVVAAVVVRPSSWWSCSVRISVIDISVWSVKGC